MKPLARRIVVASAFAIALPVAAWLLFLGAAAWKVSSTRASLRQAGYAVTASEYRPLRPMPGGGASHVREALKRAGPGATQAMSTCNAFKFRFTEQVEIYGPLDVEALRSASGAARESVECLRRAREFPGAAPESAELALWDNRGTVGVLQWNWLLDSLAAQSLLEALEGTPESALAAVLDWRRAESYFRSVPTFTGPLYGTLCLENILVLAGHAVRNGSDPGSVESWLAALPTEIEVRESCEDEDRAYIADVSDFVKQKSRDIPLVLQQLNRPAPSLPMWVLRPWIHLDTARCLMNRKEAIEAWRQPPDQAIAANRELEANLHSGSTWARPVHGLFRPHSPAFEPRVRLLARLVAVRTGLELELARCKTGSYPAALEGESPVKGVVRDYRPGVSVTGRIEGGPAFTWKLRAP